MKPHPRPPYIRKTVKWAAAAFCGVVTVAMALSTCGDLSWCGDSGLYASLAGCGIEVGHPTSCSFRGLMWYTELNCPRWAPSFERSATYSSVWFMFVPLWAFLLLALVPTTWAWWLDARAKRRAGCVCSGCNYDRAGLAANAVCPECGEAAPQDVAAR